MLTHGWPWTFWHWSKVVDPLADPGAHGGDPAEAFDVIVPSFPGFGFSSPLPDHVTSTPTSSTPSTSAPARSSPSSTASGPGTSPAAGPSPTACPRRFTPQSSRWRGVSPSIWPRTCSPRAPSPTA
ncbi:hypothetical protein [Nonomuraea sp. NPDC050202]|uniref:alpha/beta fold hydrolase n=1 Tax=Nonomuraea sp. NPDC050202 TaxID=3155035 RepID=UPI0033D651DE